MEETVSYENGIKALKAKKLYLAETIFKELIKKDSNDLNSRYALARVYLNYKNGKYKCISAFEQIIENISDRIYSNTDYGKIAIDNDDWNMASNLLKNTKSLIDNSLIARKYLKRLYKDDPFYFDKLNQLNATSELIDGLELDYNFNINSLDTGYMSKEEGKQYLDRFLEPHKSYLTQKIDYEKFLNENFIELPFKILPDGERKFENIISDKISNKTSSTRNKSYPEELSVQKRLDFLLGKKPYRGYMGIENFKGYCIFEYTNSGVSVLEKLYEEKSQKEAYENATYIFPITMALSLSQNTKTDIISKMKTHPYIKRVNHIGNYYENLDKKMKIVGISYLETHQQELLDKQNIQSIDKSFKKGGYEYDK